MPNVNCPLPMLPNPDQTRPDQTGHEPNPNHSPNAEKTGEKHRRQRGPRRRQVRGNQGKEEMDVVPCTAQHSTAAQHSC